MADTTLARDKETAATLTGLCAGATLGARFGPGGVILGGFIGALIGGGVGAEIERGDLDVLVDNRRELGEYGKIPRKSSGPYV